MMTLRSCDFFGRVVINPQEVMALSPEGRLTYTHPHMEDGSERQASCVDFMDFLWFIEVHNQCNHKVIVVFFIGTLLMFFSL